MATASEMKFKFNPAKDGITKVLGPLEAEIMQVVWQHNQATVSAVHKVLQQRREIAYTTVMTTMSRLFTKKILKRNKLGLSYLYSPIMPQEEFVNSIVKSLLDSLFEEFGEPAFKYIVSYIAASDDNHLSQLDSAIRSRRTVTAS